MGLNGKLTKYSVIEGGRIHENGIRLCVILTIPFKRQIRHEKRRKVEHSLKPRRLNPAQRSFKGSPGMGRERRTLHALRGITHIVINSTPNGSHNPLSRNFLDF